jgi:PTS system ascorbate-specific IIA component
MIGLLLITHDTLGESLLQCASHVLNKRPDQILQLGMAAGDDPNDLLPLAKKLLKLIDTGEGVLVITDIYGASPSNLAAKLLQPGKIEGVAGANLPLLLRAINNREKGMDNLLTKTTTGGRDGVLNMLKH